MRPLSFTPLYAIVTFLPIAEAAEISGVRVNFVDYSGPALLSATAEDEHEIRIDVDPQTEKEALTIQVELPIAGSKSWPVTDVAVFDANDHPVPVRRNGIEWHKISISVPPERTAFFVRAVKPLVDRPRSRPERERTATDPQTGMKTTICKWDGGRLAALSIRFDDSHPTHLSTAIPILNEYGFRGTFMVNPAEHPENSRRRSAFEDHRTEWEAVANQGRHEFANHTMNHCGAADDDSMEFEIGEAAKVISELFPEKSKLMALNLGGGTQWITSKPLRYYLDKYYLFDASSNSTGMDDVYGNRVATFRRMLHAHIERGLWYKVHYHAIGDGLSTSEANFRAALDVAKEHQPKLWIAGMAEIHKYMIERNHTKLDFKRESDSQFILNLSCLTNSELYDQPLTIDVTIPKSWSAEHVVIKNRFGKNETTQIVSKPEGVTLRFDVRPVNAEYRIEKMPQ